MVAAARAASPENKREKIEDEVRARHSGTDLAWAVWKLQLPVLVVDENTHSSTHEIWNDSGPTCGKQSRRTEMSKWRAKGIGRPRSHVGRGLTTHQ